MFKLLLYLIFSLQVLRKHGFRPTEKELTAMIKNVDKNSGDNGIDFEEFIELMVKHGSNIDENIAQSFRMFDRDGDGLITEDSKGSSCHEGKNDTWHNEQLGSSQQRILG